jgi:hypothetical protein
MYCTGTDHDLLLALTDPKGDGSPTIDNPEGSRDQQACPAPPARPRRAGWHGVTRDSDLDSTLSTDPLLAGVPSWIHVRGVLVPLNVSWA